ncbi:hypothetical protein GQ53DRAFT_821791 [Thozetella sp. PMI_491]|nr:hypothetical protein GQ53DRAFT_821791 [Thozetella sp. PMI_491]
MASGIGTINPSSPNFTLQHATPMAVATGITALLSYLPRYFGFYTMGPSKQKDLLLDWYQVPAAKQSLVLMHNITAALPLVFNISDNNSLGNFTRIVVNGTQYVYAYGLRGVTVWLAFIVLSLHIVTVVVHMVIMLFGKPWASSAWSNLGDLVLMALYSPPPSFPDNDDASINLIKVWKLRASVEEVGDGQRVGLVLREQSSSWKNGVKEEVGRRILKADKVYS